MTDGPLTEWEFNPERFDEEVDRYLDENFHWCMECGAQVHNDHRNVHEVWHTKIEQQIRLGF